MKIHSAWTAALLAIVGACAAPEDGALESSEDPLIRDEAGAFWLPPIAPTLPFSLGAFEPRLDPVVAIDQVDAQGATVRNVVTYRGSSLALGERILRNLALKYYVVRFHSALANLDPALDYRVRMLPAPGQPALAVADLDVVNNVFEYLRVDRRSRVPLLRGTTLPIRFRIDKSAVDRDGDGVFDWLDNCPSVKNPPPSLVADVPAVTTRAASSCDRDQTSCDPQEQPLNPLAPKQADSDGDGVGDACDCPAGQVGAPPSCAATKPFTTLCQCDDGTIYEACTNVCGGEPGEPTSCLLLCGGAGSDIGCSLPGDPACDPSAPCRSGFYPRVPGRACEDIDECERDTDGCAPDSICRNNDGSFICQPCGPGSVNDGTDTCTPAQP